MSVALLLAVTASFATSTKKFLRPAFYLEGGVCMYDYTEQIACSTTLTGPVCTVFNGGFHNTALNTTMDGGTPCTIPLRQP
ncbi:hypothetical protein HQN83_02600 [Pedobacter sp. LMG 31643]|nr:hypothetical protein [Pedobacter foliorum]